MWLAIHVTRNYEENTKYEVTKEMMDAAPEFETQKAANHYADLIDSGDKALWVIMPKEENQTS